MTPNKAPWWWKLPALALMAGGITLLFVPALIHATELWIRLLFVAGAALLAGLGMAVLKSKPPSLMLRCPQCGSQSRRSALIYYCAECGHALHPGDDELKPSEINCPFCDEPIAKGLKACAQCSKPLPSFGIGDVKGHPSCLWCKTQVQSGQKFCAWCSAPLASSTAQSKSA